MSDTPIIPQRTCTKCGETFPATADFFYKKERGLYGLFSHCKKCHNAMTKPKSTEWAKTHPVETKQARDRHTEKNHDVLLANARIKYRDNPEPNRVRCRKWRQNNRLKHAIKSQRRRARVSNAEGTYTHTDLLQMYEDQGGHCAYCGIGIFWDIPKDVHIEHIIPLSRGGSNWSDNICLTCASCNLSKGDKTVVEWEVIREW